MNKLDTLKEELREEIRLHISNEKKRVKLDKSMRPMDVMQVVSDKIGISINVLYHFIRRKEIDFKVSTLSKVCDYLDLVNKRTETGQI